MPQKKPDIKNLYYITHVDNLPSIVEHGILSHRQIENRSLAYEPIYDKDIVNIRAGKIVDGESTLWDFANLYFQPRNPMLYRVLYERGPTDIAIVAVNAEVLYGRGVLVSTGNASSGASDILPSEVGLKEVKANWKIIDSEWWNSADGSKRIIMAECLVPSRVGPESILSIYVASHTAAERVRKMGIPSRISVVPEPYMFFRPARRIQVTDKIALGDGDMFFSTMQTLTISVNVVGVMGRGLASRTKYQFPDVYVVYQDACRRKHLKVDKPYLYKREGHIAEEMADEPSTLSPTTSYKWFLLFATKRHWRDNSNLDDIEEGLRWLKANYRDEGIQSLAMPALGCGLGGLEWRAVGPVMCRHLREMDIPISIYLPRETNVPQEYLEPEYLLGSS